jgi:outer membrane lipoprotein-sorting protein
MPHTLDFAAFSAIYRGMMINKLLLRAGLAMALALAAVPAAVQAKPAVAAQLTEQDRTDLQRIERYLNEIRTLTSPFLQVGPDGGQSRGTLALSRPGRIRIEYEPPNSLLVVSAGGAIAVYDRDLKQVNYVTMDQTPLGVLVREQIRLSGDVTVTRFERGSNVLRITLAKSNDAQAGRVTLTFDDRPLQLRQWVITDPQGTDTRVSLLDPKLGVTLDAKLFTFIPPERGGAGGAGGNR